MNRYHQRVLDAINTMTQGVSELELTRCAGEKWSIAQTLEHLGLAFGHTAKTMNRALEAGKPIGDKPTIKQRAISALVVGIGYFPEGRPAPKIVVPTGTLDGKAALDLIHGNLAAMDRAHAKCVAKFGHQGFVANHPVLGPLTITQWPKFHWVHTRHHMKHLRARKQSG
jgi:hypothetical protein